MNYYFSDFFSVCPYLFVCGFDLSVWYQVLFDMICLHRTSFCILCSFLFGLLFLYLLVLNVFQLFFVYPFLFQFHPCFLCFSLSIILLSAFVKGFSNFGLPISLPFLPLFSYEEVNCLSCITLFTNMWQLVGTKLATNTKVRTKLSITSKFWKVSFCCHLSICLIKTTETGTLFKIFCLKVLNLKGFHRLIESLKSNKIAFISIPIIGYTYEILILKNGIFFRTDGKLVCN